MKNGIFLMALLFIFITSIIYGQESKPELADNILNTAFEESKTTEKNIFLIFHASWCGWCKRLDKAIQSDELKKIFEDNYLVIHLDVLESKDKVDLLENPGGREILNKLGGEKSGLPFYAFLDASGEKITDSNVMSSKNPNIGYPGSLEEIEAFRKLLKLTAKNLADKQFEIVIEYLKKKSPSLQPEKKS